MIILRVARKRKREQERWHQINLSSYKNAALYIARDTYGNTNGKKILQHRLVVRDCTCVRPQRGRNLGHKGLIGDTRRAYRAFTTCHRVAMHFPQHATLIPFASKVDKYSIMTRRIEFEVSQSGVILAHRLRQLHSPLSKL